MLEFRTCVKQQAWMGGTRWNVNLDGCLGKLIKALVSTALFKRENICFTLTSRTFQKCTLRKICDNTGFC